MMVTHPDVLLPWLCFPTANYLADYCFITVRGSAVYRPFYQSPLLGYSIKGICSLVTIVEFYSVEFTGNAVPSLSGNINGIWGWGLFLNWKSPIITWVPSVLHNFLEYWWCGKRRTNQMPIFFICQVGTLFLFKATLCWVRDRGEDEWVSRDSSRAERWYAEWKVF